MIDAEDYATRECCSSCKNINHYCKEPCECWTFARNGVMYGYSKCKAEVKEIIKNLLDDLIVLEGEPIGNLSAVKVAKLFLEEVQINDR